MWDATKTCLQSCMGRKDSSVSELPKIGYWDPKRIKALEKLERNVEMMLSS